MAIEITLPVDMDEDFLLNDAESFAEAIEKAKEGRLDTHMVNDLPDGQYEGEIVHSGITNTRTKDGDTGLPRFSLQVRTPQWTATSGFPLASDKFNANEMLLRTVLGLLGTIPADTLTKDPRAMSFRDKIDFFSALAAKCNGLKVIARVSTRETEKGKFKNFSVMRAA